MTGPGVGLRRDAGIGGTATGVAESTVIRTGVRRVVAIVTF
jgi:hypothetical protein